MESGSSFLVLTLVLLQFLTYFCTAAPESDNMSYVKDVCNATRYPDICVHSLASYSNIAKQNFTTWARAGVSVTIHGAKSVSQYLIKLKRDDSMRGRNRAALLDCIEVIEDSIDNLHKSLGVLRILNEQEFFDQMGDVTTWLSSALTDEETCLEGFDGEKGNQIKFLCQKVMNVSYVTSNALALVNKLESSGPQSLIEP